MTKVLPCRLLRMVQSNEHGAKWEKRDRESGFFANIYPTT